MAGKMTPPTEDEEARLAEAVRASAQQIWQAGLGAFAKAQQEGGRAFTRLVKDGTELQKRARRVEDATDTVARAAERASRRASGSWGKLEQVFEERVARALAAIGVPARSEVEALSHRIDELEKMLAERPAAPAGAPVKARARPAAGTTPAKGPAKPAARSVVKSAARPAAKAALEAAAKPVARVAAKPAAKSAAAPAAKPAAKKTSTRKRAAS